jgi:hypothetical protein
MNPNDILLWPDGFWCFREEHSPGFMREANYREIAQHGDEWNLLSVQRPAQSIQ